MKAALLVLSDIHITSARDPILGATRSVAQACYATLPHVDAAIVLIAGDVAFSGKSEQYALALNFFREIGAQLRAERDVPIHFAVVPGNHDCDFQKDSPVRQALIDSILRGNRADSQMIELCTGVQDAFFQFRDALEGKQAQATPQDRLWRVVSIPIGNEVITVEAINMAWLSKLNETVGGLTFPWEDVAPAVVGSAAGMRIAIQHHPANWMSQQTYRPYRAFLKQRSHLVITGHEHVPNVGLTIDTEAASTTFAECGPLQEGKSLEASSFLLLTIDTAEERLTARSFSFNGERYAQAQDEPWEHAGALTLSADAPFVLRPAFERLLNDPGAPIRGADGRDIELVDFFVYPDMTDLAAEGKPGTVNLYSSRELGNLEFMQSGAFLVGEAKSGRTSLLRQLYLRYREAGLLPVIISGADLKHTQLDSLQRVVRVAYEAQYETEFLHYDQASRTEKVILVDNFQLTTVRSQKHRQTLLKNLRALAGATLVVCDRGIPIEETHFSDGSMRRFGIQPLGFRARHDLIMRWHGFSDPNLSEAEFLVRCDDSERVVNHVMTRKVIPASPLYLVTLLQSLTVHRGTELIDSSLGHYYHYLITEAFRGAKAPMEKFNAHFDFCSHLAWAFHQKGSDEMSEVNFRQFVAEYSKVWTRVDAQERLDFLLNAMILERRGSSVAFRYPYVHYYLKGRYLASQLEDSAVRAYIEQACAQLYVRDNANTVLFLAHHAHDDFFIRSIQRSLDGLFGDLEAVSFDGDVRDMTALVTDAPKLIFEGGSPKHHRAEVTEMQDDMDDGEDGLMEAPEDGDKVSFQALTTMLFKTTEVLGLILKAQYSRLKHERKQELLESVFNGSMRGLRAVYKGLIEEPELLQRGARQLSTDTSKDERGKRMERIIAFIIEVLSFAYVMHASDCARSPDLAEDVAAVARRSSKTSFELIEIAICLDSGEALPRAELREMQKKVKDNLVASRLLTFVVLYRLYMFETSEEDKIWVGRQFGLGYGATKSGSAIAGASSSISGLVGVEPV